jgi:asparagine synthase (glutamine-hydrolysing)
MCGILFLDLDASSPRADADAVTASHAVRLKPRGPDASVCEVACGGRHLLCFHRLAIIATAGQGGMQPVRRGTTRLICTGEVYNHRQLGNVELGRVDVAVVLDLLVRDDAGGLLSDPQQVAAAVGRLDGDFAFVAVDEGSGRVVAARDPLGVRPLFMGLSAAGAVVAFASEAKALFGAPGVADVRVFPPGHVCLLGGEAPAEGILRRYDYHADEGQRTSTTTQAAPKAVVRRLLERAVEKRMLHSERPVALLCSGGIDSAAALSIAARLAKAAGAPAPRVFTMRYGPGQSDDAFYASMLCQRLGCVHDVVSFGPEDLSDATLRAVVTACETCDPNTVRAALPMYLLAKHIAESTDVKAVLSGEGADELFGGYGYFRLAPTPTDAADECGRLLRNLHMFDLLRADRCFAAHGLEVRVPFLDRDLVDGVARLDPAERVRGEKQLLRDAVEDLEELAALRILDRPKEKFSDGAGFSYVPDLLRRLAADWGVNGDDGTLPCRLEAERRAYAAMFEDAYGAPVGRWVVERTVPTWVEAAAKAASSSANGCSLT